MGLVSLSRVPDLLLSRIMATDRGVDTNQRIAWLLRDLARDRRCVAALVAPFSRRPDSADDYGDLDARGAYPGSSTGP
jgi:hypothetical protein